MIGLGSLGTALALAAALAVTYGTWKTAIQTEAHSEGIAFERSRVLTEERNMRDHIEAKQRDHRARSTAARVSPLAKWEQP